MRYWIIFNSLYLSSLIGIDKGFSAALGMAFFYSALGFLFALALHDSGEGRTFVWYKSGRFLVTLVVVAVSSACILNLITPSISAGYASIAGAFSIIVAFFKRGGGGWLESIGSSVVVMFALFAMSKCAPSSDETNYCSGMPSRYCE